MEREERGGERGRERGGERVGERWERREGERGRGGRERDRALCISFLSLNVLLKGESN